METTVCQEFCKQAYQSGLSNGIILVAVSIMAVFGATRLFDKVVSKGCWGWGSDDDWYERKQQTINDNSVSFSQSVRPDREPASSLPKCIMTPVSDADIFASLSGPGTSSSDMFAAPKNRTRLGTTAVNQIPIGISPKVSRTEELNLIDAASSVLIGQPFTKQNIFNANGKHYNLYPLYINNNVKRPLKEYTNNVIGVRVNDSDYDEATETFSKNAIITEVIDIGGLDSRNRGTLTRVVPKKQTH